jgi:hypothetical protein
MMMNLTVKSNKDRLSEIYIKISASEEVHEIEKYESIGIDYRVAKCIANICERKNIDSNLVFAILIQENPTFDHTIKGRRNRNGTYDCGLFQLNSRYMNDFEFRYWDIRNTKFDPFNYSHNSYVAISLIKTLFNVFDGDYNKVIMAYNCGATSVIRNKIPHSTKNYLKSVNENLIMLNRLNHSTRMYD